MMHFVLTLIAAVVATIVWYKKKVPGQKEPYKIIALVYMYAGAALMWLGDLIMGFVEDGYKVFFPGEEAKLEEWQAFFHASMNDVALGIATIALGLLIWLIILLISDPKGMFKKKAQ